MKDCDDNRSIMFTPSSSGKTLLHCAVLAGQEKIVTYLVSEMPDSTLQSKEGENKYTALALAAITSGKTKIAKCIVEGRSKELVSIEDKNGFIPVVLASDKGHKHMTRYLFKNTSIPNENKSDGYNQYNGVYLLCNCIRSEIFGVDSDNPAAVNFLHNGIFTVIYSHCLFLS